MGFWLNDVNVCDEEDKDIMKNATIEVKNRNTIFRCINLIKASCGILERCI